MFLLSSPTHHAPLIFFVCATHDSLVYLPKTAKIGALVDIQDSEDPEGLRVFYYLVQDLKVRTHSYHTLVSLYFLPGSGAPLSGYYRVYLRSNVMADRVFSVPSISVAHA